MKTRWIIFIFILCSASAIIFALSKHSGVNDTQQNTERAQSSPKDTHANGASNASRTIASIEQTQENPNEGLNNDASEAPSERLNALTRAELDHIYPGSEPLEAPEITEIKTSESENRSHSGPRKPVGFIRDVLVRGDKDFPAIAARQWLDVNGNVTRESLVVADEVLVKIRNGKTLRDLAQVVERHQMSVATGIQDNGLVILRFKASSPNDYERKITSISDENGVIEHAIPNGIVKAR